MEKLCWNCGSAADGRFCPKCHALQAPASDPFEFFEVPPQLSVDLKDLEKRFYALSRQLHPDLFSRKPAQEKAYSLDATANLNDGYRTLRDPVLRAQLVLKREGFEVGEQGTKDVPPELLEEVFELNMALEEMRSGDEDAREQIRAARTKFEQMRDGLDQELGELFRTWDSGHGKEALVAIRAILNRRKYIGNLLAQTETA